MSHMVTVHKYLPTSSDVHFDSNLTDFSVAYRQEDNVMLSSSIFPMKPVKHQTDKYRIWPKADHFRDEAQKRAPATPVPRGGFRMSQDNYSCDIYQWGGLIPNEVMENADNPAELDQITVNYVMGILDIRREVDFVATYLTTGVWGTDITGVNSGAVPGTSVLRWNVSSSTPIEDVQAARRAVKLATGKRPNTMILGWDVRDALNTNTQILARLVNGQTPGQIAEVSDADLARIFKVDRVIVAEAVYNTLKENVAGTSSMSFIAGKIAWVGYVDPSPGTLSLTAGATFVWTGMRGGSPVGTKFNRWFDQEIYSEKIDAFANWDMKVTAADAGYFFDSIVA